MKRSFRRFRTGVSHAGPHQHHDQHQHNPQCAYRCQGIVLEVLDDQLYVRVEHAHGRAKRWVGHDVPFALKGSEIHDTTGSSAGILRPGDLVEIRTRLSRKPDLQNAEPLPVHRIHILQTAPPDRIRQAHLLKMQSA